MGKHPKAPKPEDIQHLGRNTLALDKLRIFLTPMPRKSQQPLSQEEIEKLRRNPPDVVTLQEAAIYVGQSEKTVRRWIEKGIIRKLPSRKISIPINSIKGLVNQTQKFELLCLSEALGLGTRGIDAATRTVEPMINSEIFKRYLRLRRRGNLIASVDKYWPLNTAVSKVPLISKAGKRRWLLLRDAYLKCQSIETITLHLRLNRISRQSTKPSRR